jgi:hypothetical protein
MAKDDKKIGSEKEETVQLTMTQLQELMQSATTAAVKAAMDQLKPADDGKPKTPDELHQDLRDSLTKMTPLPQQNVLCKSPHTGATFVAEVSPSRSYPQGRIIRISDYQWPDGHDRHQNEGGLVPDGMQIFRKDTGQPYADYKQWKWSEFFQVDLRAWVGKPLPPYLRADAQDVPVPPLARPTNPHFQEV